MIELNVPFVEKEEAKRLGARWNGATKRWYIPNGVDHQMFARWLPDDFSFEILPAVSLANSKDRTEYSLAAFLAKVSDVVQSNFPGSAWISAEISELRLNKGHMFITLVEHDEQGNMLARSSARIWQSQVEIINRKFAQGTGADLEAGIKVLVYARVEFHAQYGLALFIDDIDPTYTLGDMAAKLAKIREVLTTEKIIANNKQLPRPIDFLRVAVISPRNAAGLGDFSREADILQRNNLCQFVYLTATFQGEQAANDICKAITEAVNLHQQQAFDALVIIRGGGALSDLAWLNNEQLARAVCLCPIHVMVGIGHERDYTIIDEVAGERFDTPSKVSHRIFNVITSNAIEADTAYAEIAIKVEHVLRYAQQRVHTIQQEIAVAALNMLQRIDERITSVHKQLGEYVVQACISLEKQLKLLIAEILSQSPQQVLAKGFALVANKHGKIITAKQQALIEATLTLQFHDGSLTVTPQGENRE